MIFDFQFVDHPHPITGDPTSSKPLQFPEQCPEFLKQYQDWSLIPTNRALLCFHENHIVGILRYNFCNGEFSSEGTFVDPRYQQRQIATKLWIRALNQENPKIIKVQLATTEGKKLITRVKKIFYHLDWKIKEYDDI